MFAQQVVSGLAVGTLYAMMALGIVLIYKAQETINFAQGEMAMVSTFFSYTLFTRLHWNYWIAFAAGIGFGLLLGLVIERILIRPVENASHFTIITVTIGVNIVLNHVAGMVWGHDTQVFRSAIPSQAINVGGVVVSPIYLFIIAIAFVLSTGLFVFFQYTKMGKAILATSQNRVAARLVGIRPAYVSAFAWGASSALGALAGLLFAPIVFLDVNMMFVFLIKAFSVCVLGGMTSLPGAILAGLALGVTENLVGGYVSSELKDTLAFAVIIAVLFVKPTGLFGAVYLRKV